MTGRSRIGLFIGVLFGLPFLTCAGAFLALSLLPCELIDDYVVTCTIEGIEVGHALQSTLMISAAIFLTLTSLAIFGFLLTVIVGGPIVTVSNALKMRSKKQ